MRVDLEDFLTELKGLFENARDQNSDTVWVTYKRYINVSKKKGHIHGKEISLPDEQPFCLVRAKHRKKKISTLVSQNCTAYFLSMISGIIRHNLELST